MEYKGPFHGFLTTDDRRFLTGEKELNTDAERATRSRIRKRILNGMLDFKLLCDELEQSDWELLFEEPRATEPQRDSPEIHERTTWVIAFLFKGFMNYSSTDFESVLSDGIREAEWTEGRKLRSAELQLKYSETLKEETHRKLKQGEDLTDEERQAIIERLEFRERLREASESLGIK
jgi:hypothetical protein